MESKKRKFDKEHETIDSLSSLVGQEEKHDGHGASTSGVDQLSENCSDDG